MNQYTHYLILFPQNTHKQIQILHTKCCITNAELNQVLYVRQNSTNQVLYVCQNSINQVLYVRQNSINQVSYVRQNSINQVSYIRQNSINQVLYVCQKSINQVLYLRQNSINQVLYVRQNSTNQVLLDFNLEYNLKTEHVPKLNTKPILLLPETLNCHHFFSCNCCFLPIMVSKGKRWNMAKLRYLSTCNSDSHPVILHWTTWLMSWQYQDTLEPQLVPQG